MAVPTNTIQNVNRVGVREDLSNKIAELFPDDTPFLNAIGTGKCSATKTEWQTDGLAAANPAKVVSIRLRVSSPPCRGGCPSCLCSLKKYIGAGGRRMPQMPLLLRWLRRWRGRGGRLRLLLLLMVVVVVVVAVVKAGRRRAGAESMAAVK